MIDDTKMQHVDESDIRQYFKGIGTIEAIEIPRDHITLRPKGYILIDFAKADEAKDAVNLLNGFEIDGKKINV
jgi:RNA-binding protein 39